MGKYRRTKREAKHYKNRVEISNREAILNSSEVIDLDTVPDYTKCECGKKRYSPIGAAAEVQARLPEFRRSYFCKIGGTYHVTSMELNGSTEGVTKNSDTKFKPLGLVDMTAKQTELTTIIVKFMEDLWDRDTTYRVTSKQVVDHINKVKPHRTEAYIRSELSKLKSSGVLVNLDEFVPKGNGAKYFALSKVVDEMTDPNNAKEEETVSNKVPAQNTPATVANNPFDKVNTQLEQLMSMVSGLAQGYAERSGSTISAAVDVNETAIKELKLWGDGLEIRLTRAMQDAITNVDGSEDFKRGIREGIRMSVEMRLMIRDSDQTGHAE